VEFAAVQWPIVNRSTATSKSNIPPSDEIFLGPKPPSEDLQKGMLGK